MIHHPDQTPLQSSVTVLRCLPGPTAAALVNPHDTESATLDPPPRPPMRDPQTVIHGAATEPLDLLVLASSGVFALLSMIQAELEATLRLKVNLTGNWFVLRVEIKGEESSFSS
ncbi:unnamed protein product [Pleuronectes platessa]|uniref:Uncharacterized protein n=1 Tax=Pleuronectes platessa TaxID=8262 RepID=A0A9N7TJU1_PLEPL|nr:unnamed protein product [Pleuronectes platessa]